VKRKTRSKTSKRTTIEPHKADRRYVRRNKKGKFKKEVNVGRSLAADRRRKSKGKSNQAKATGATPLAGLCRR
jgi:adenylylsulfate kinase-like enzyme